MTQALIQNSLEKYAKIGQNWLKSSKIGGNSVEIHFECGRVCVGYAEPSVGPDCK